MGADDKESAERRQSRSLERDRGKCQRHHCSANPSPPKQRHKRSCSPDAEELYKHKNSAKKPEDRKCHKLSNRNVEGISEEDNGRTVSKKNGVEDDEKAVVRMSSKEDRKVELHSSGDSRKDAYSDNETDRGRRKSRSINHKSRKSKSKHHRHARSKSEQDEAQTECTSGESFEDSEDEYRRANRQKRLKQKEKGEREKKEERRREKAKLKKWKVKEKERDQEKRNKKKEKVMAADDKESAERRQSRSLERDQGKCQRHHCSANPSPPKQRHKRSCSPDAKELHKHKNSAKKPEDRKCHKLSNRNVEGISEEDNGRTVSKKNGVEDDEKAVVRMSSKEDRKVELHSSGDSRKDAYSDNETDRGRRKSRSINHKSRKSKSKHHRHARSKSEQDEAQTECTSGESFEDSEDEYRRANRRKRLKQKEKAEREKKEERRREKAKLKKWKVKEKERDQEKRNKKKKKVEERVQSPIIDEVRDCLEGNNMHGESSNKDPVLEPKHKIFLSHSGAQKEFVEHLCKALEDRCHYPFFDRRHESLPKGERFPELIVQAVEQCEMLIVVVSNEYFMSKWPMIELNAFVKAHRLHHGSKIGSKILPLFYGLSVSDLDNEGMRKKWFREWKTLAEADPKNRIVVNDWKNALNVLRSFNGLSYDRNLKEVVAYEDKIVSHVCNSIASDIKWDDSHVQGKSNICKIIDKRIEGIGVSRKYQVKVVGIYGVGGIGKTTTCKTLCNELSRKYEGRVCHIEFPSVPSFESKELFQKVVRDLTRKSVEVIQALDRGQCKDILHKSVSNQRTFMAIDNISDNYQSILEAKTLLEVPYHKDSLVLVTARSQSVLERLGIDEDACFEMPDLEEVDAVNLFLHHAIGGKRFFGVEENRDIMTCIKRCYFSKGNGRDHHYHPLALQALGLQLGLYGENPCEWVRKLSQVDSFDDFSGENRVFGILRVSFDMLSREDQTLFMDVGFFIALDMFNPDSRIEWLCIIHKQDEGALLLRMERLKRKGFVQDVLSHGRISMHDLYLEFAKLEASGSFYKSSSLCKRMWMYVEDGDLTELESNRWDKLIRLYIGQHSPDFEMHPNGCRIEGLESLKWSYFSHVQILKLSEFGDFRYGALNLEGLIQLRVLYLYNVYEIDVVEGLEKLKHLTIFIWRCRPKKHTGAHIVGQLPSSLKQLIINGMRVVVSSDILARCSNLLKLSVTDVEVHSLDLSNCSSLETVELTKIGKLQTLSIGATCLASHLQYLSIHHCEDLVDIQGIDHFTDLTELHISSCPKWEVPSLIALTKLQALNFGSQHRLVPFAKDSFPRQLRELHWRFCHIGEGLNLIGFNQLEVLDLSYDDDLTSLANLGDLPALQHLSLTKCRHLLRLPALSLSRSLKVLKLDECLALELHEEDIQMLCELPMLEPVPFSGQYESRKFRLDFARGKVLVYSTSNFAPGDWDLWKEGEWKERDLGAPPLKIGRRGTWDTWIEWNSDLEIVELERMLNYI